MRILVADDEDVSRAFLRTLLVGHGYEVIEAADGAEALAKAREDPPDLIISDILMPNMDGYQLCIEWRQDPELKDLPFIFCAASCTDLAGQDLASNVGADRFVRTPAEPAELIRAVEELLTEVFQGVERKASASIAQEAATLKEYSKRLVSKLEDKLLEIQDSNRELRVAQEVLAQEMEVKNDLIEQLHLDIEKRKRIEAELRCERDITSQVIEVADLAIIGLDMDGRIELFSRGAESITGYEADQVMGTSYFDTFVPQPARRFQESHFDSLKTSGVPMRITKVMCTRSGRERILDWADTVRTDGEGNVTGLIGFGLDVTERVRRDVCETVLAKLGDAVLFEESMDEALFSLCVKLAQALRLKLVTIATTDAEGELVVRASAGRLADSPPSAHGSLGGLLPDADDLEVASTLSIPLTAFGDTFGTLVFFGRHPDTFDGEFTALLRMVADRIALILLLSENQQQLKIQSAALQAAVSAIVITDADGMLVWANPSYERLTGRCFEDDVGRRLDIFRETKEDVDRTSLLEAMLEGRSWTAEIESVRTGGSEYVEEVTLGPVVDMTGEVGHFIVVRQDITERKHLEQMKSDFLSMVSHELRTPLTSIIGYADLLLRDIDGEKHEHRFAQKIRSHGSDMQGLVEELLEVSHMQTDSPIPLDLRPTRLDEAVHRYADSVPLASEHILEYDIAEDLPAVVCDPGRVGHIISNLVSNAAKYSPGGGRIVVSLQAAGDVVRLSVSDSGIGITPEYLDRIFDRFTQADMSATREFGGFGLGLFIVKTLADVHGGGVSVKSELGKGSTFTVELPISGPR